MENSNVTITIPENWSEVTLRQYSQIDANDVVATAAVLFDIDQETVRHLDMSLDDLLGHLSFISQEPTVEYQPRIGNYRMVEIDSLSVGDIEQLERLCKDFKKNVVQIANWMYRTDIDGILLEDLMTVDQLYGAMSFVQLRTGYLLMPDHMDQVFDNLRQVTEPGQLEKMLGFLDTQDNEKLQETITKLKQELNG
jgi:hypothetical protein